ncbi:regucalcin [Thozetella sp. PMI_491]|nr:regucalcin [Thozetella sp. PMI_491]
MGVKEIPQWQAEPYLEVHAALGEGPFYEKATNTLRFVDIINKRLHTVDLAQGPQSLKTAQLDVAVSVTSDIEGVDPQEKILLGLKHGIAVFDRKAEKYEYVARFFDGDEGKRVRSNDGATDPHGRFWLGTMTDFGLGDFQQEGALFRFDANKTRETVLSDLTIPNSVGWSPDGKIMYFTETISKVVSAWDYSLADGSRSNKRVFYQHATSGGPDGFRVDKDGNIWHAVYGESRVIKLSPEGELIGQVNVPTRHVTCVEFVGTQLYITTASDDEGEGDSKKYGGAVFKAEVGTTGLEAYKFKLPA